MLRKARTKCDLLQLIKQTSSTSTQWGKAEQFKTYSNRQRRSGTGQKNFRDCLTLGISM